MKKMFIALLASAFIVALTPGSVNAGDPGGGDPIRPHVTSQIICIDYGDTQPDD